MKQAACVLAAMLATGCAVVTDGTTQSIRVETTPKPGAACDAGNGRGTWHLPATPGSITVSKAYADLTISCKHADGSFGSQTLVSSTKGAVLGSAVLFGGIGVIADVASGAAYEYPPVVSVALATGGAPTTAPAPTPAPTAGVPTASVQPAPATTPQVAALNLPVPPSVASAGWTPPATGARFVTRAGGHFQVQSIDGEVVRTSNGRNEWAKWMHGAIYVRDGSVAVKQASGKLFPLAVGNTATFVEQVNWTGSSLEHRVKVTGYREVEIEHLGKVGVFEIVDDITPVPAASRGEERRHSLYAPSLGFLVSHSSDNAKVGWEVARVEQPKS